MDPPWLIPNDKLSFHNNNNNNFDIYIYIKIIIIYILECGGGMFLVCEKKLI